MMIALIVLFVALQLADIASTVRALDKGARELNPVVRWIMARLGTVPGLIVIKGAGCAAIIAGILFAHAYSPTIALIAMAIFCAAYAYVVLHNLRQVKG